MHTAQYRFSTTWRIEAPLPAVWAAVRDASHWPRWWKNVERVVEIASGTSEGIGAVHRYTWKGVLPYRIVFDMHVTHVDPLIALEGEATGDVRGTGRWQFSNDGDATIVRYDWQIHTSRPWMNLLAPVARPFFRWNHDVVMREGGKSLARLLNARLVSIEET